MRLEYLWGSNTFGVRIPLGFEYLWSNTFDFEYLWVLYPGKAPADGLFAQSTAMARGRLGPRQPTQAKTHFFDAGGPRWMPEAEAGSRVAAIRRTATAIEGVNPPFKS